MLVALVSVIGSVIGMAVVGALGWLVKEQVAQGRALAAIQAQYRNNGGSSLRDAVDRIEHKQDETTKTLQDHLVVAAGDSARLAAHLSIYRNC